MEMIKKKWSALWLDNRNYFKRLTIAALPCFLVSFMLFMFGPLDIMAGNARFLSVYANDYLIPYIKLTACVWVGLSTIVSIFRGKIFDWFRCLILGLSVCMYVQGAFLNLDLGTLNGETIAWHLYWQHGIYNLLAWSAIILVIFGIHYFFRESFNGIALFTCVLLLVMQGTGLVYVMLSTEAPEVELVCSSEEQYVVSDEENVIVFVLDAFSSEVMNRILKKNDEISAAYSDFTYYDNLSTRYIGTFPGELHILTGWDYLPELPYEENIERAWSSERVQQIYSTLKKNGYESYLYRTSTKHVAGNDISRIEPVFANIFNENRTDVSPKTVKMFVQLALYRYVPHALKANFWMYTGDIDSASGGDSQVEGDHTFYTELLNHGLSVSSEGKRFIYYKLIGAHGPYTMDRYGNYVPEGTTKEEQAEGYLVVLQEYFNQLKELGLYDNATILITADHGNAKYPHSICLVKEKGQSSDQLVRNSAPVNQSEIMPTILAALGLPYDGLGESFYDIDPNTERERTVYTWELDENYPVIPKADYNVFHQFTYVGDDAEARRVISEKENMVVWVLADSYY